MLIDAFTPNWQDRLTDMRQPFLLIDGAFLPALYREVRKAGPVTLLFEHLPGCTDTTRAVSPFLVTYSSSSISLKRSLAKCSGWPMLSAIETLESMEELATRLAAWCIVENDGQRFNFRFPDTRRLPALFDSLSPAQRGSLAGPASRWSYIGRDGTWYELALAESAQAVAERPFLDDDQFAAMVGDSEVDETILLLRDRRPLPDQRPSERYAIVSAARRVAVVSRLDRDLILDWCEDCLHNTIRLTEIDAIATLMAWQEKSKFGEP
jgi:hypothetical protein